MSKNFFMGILILICSTHLYSMENNESTVEDSYTYSSPNYSKDIHSADSAINSSQNTSRGSYPADDEKTISVYASSSSDIPTSQLFQAIYDLKVSRFKKQLNLTPMENIISAVEDGNNIVSAILRKTPYTNKHKLLLYSLHERLQKADIQKDHIPHKGIPFTMLTKIPVPSSSKQTTALHLVIDSLGSQISTEMRDHAGLVLAYLLNTVKANPYIEDSDHKNAIEYAAEKGYDHLSQYLEQEAHQNGYWEKRKELTQAASTKSKKIEPTKNKTCCFDCWK